MKTIVLATRNAHKVEELQALLGNLIELKPLPVDFTTELPETGRTLEENSAQKALFLYEQLGVDCLADDSGLEVYALNGEPGVDSAHYSGTRDSVANLNLVLQKLGENERRNARFRCVLSLMEGGVLRQFEGKVEGYILIAPTGGGGFGYDPIFRPDGYDVSFAQMSAEAKNKISHRGRAVESLMRYLQVDN